MMSNIDRDTLKGGMKKLELMVLITVILSGGVVTAENITAQFAAVPATGQVPLDVSFIDLSGGNVSGWNWSYGDGYYENNTYLVPNITSLLHTYSIPGLYNVTLTAFNVSNVSENSTITLNNCINVTPSLVFANFTAVSNRSVAPFNVQFLDTSTGNPVAWRWDFGDGTRINEQGPNHTYEYPGVYNVSLDIYNKTGILNSTIRDGFITVLSPTVTAKLTYVYADLLNLKKIQFYDKSEGVGINNWTWDFGDSSSICYDADPVHDYSTSGKYTVNLSISNGYTNGSTTYMVGIR